MQLQADPLTYAPAIVANYVRLGHESGAGVQICGFPWSPSSEIFGSQFEAIFLRSMLELMEFLLGSLHLFLRLVRLCLG